MKKGKKAVTLSLASLLAFSVFTTSVSASVSSSDVDRIPETVSVTESEVGTVEPQNLPAVARGLAKAGKEAWNWYKKIPRRNNTILRFRPEFVRYIYPR